MKKELTINKLVEIRRRAWEKSKDTENDRKLCTIIAETIVTNEKLLKEVCEKPYLIIEACFSLVDKKRQTVPFFFNEVQRDFIDKISTQGTEKPYFILKGRQQGFTTLITAIQLSYAILRRNFSGFTLADRDDNTKAIFIDKAKVMYNFLPSILKPTEKFNSVNELYFDKINSSWRIASATANVGRSRTLSFIHFSEVAFFKCSLADLQKSIVEAATENAFCVYETTANGFNDAKALWDNGSCYNLFYEWWKTKEYVSYEYEYLSTNDKWLIDRLKTLEQRGLSRPQLAWYAKKYNSYIDKSSIKQEYPCSPEEAFVVSSDSIFDKEAISNYLSNFKVLSTQGRFNYKKERKLIYYSSNEDAEVETSISQIEFVADKCGYISIVEHPHRIIKDGKIEEKPYVIGADTAGSGDDYFTAKVIDNTSGKCVATLHCQRIDEDLFAEQLYCLGKYYNNALLAVEVNFSSHPVKILEDLCYENLYCREKIKSPSPYSNPEPTHGFLTTAANRSIMISNLVAIMRENIFLETDRRTLLELTTFVKHKDGKTAAASGSHDDLVMASAIAHFVGENYTHNIQTIDTGSSILSKSFTERPQNTNQIMEW